jgi:hypothetical protein
MMSSDRRMPVGAGKGLVAGMVSVAVMTLGEKVEQVFTHRPSSFVPAHTLERLPGRSFEPDGHRRGFNLAMHWGQGIALGALRGAMADLLHKGVYGFVTGVVADRLARPEPVWVQARRDRSDPLHHRRRIG